MAIERGTYRSRYGIPGKDVKLLSARWQKGLKDGTWDSFDDFVKWASESGYFCGAHLHRYNVYEPHGPDNSFWHLKEKKEKEVVHRKVNETEMPTQHPCPSCPINETCGKPCITRQLWWNVQMEKVRKAMETWPE